MILEVALLHIRTDQSAAFEAAFLEAKRIISAMPGYVSHELQRCIERPDEYVLACTLGVARGARDRFSQVAGVSGVEAAVASLLRARSRLFCITSLFEARWAADQPQLLS
jgi:hypothetical protein